MRRVRDVYVGLSFEEFSVGLKTPPNVVLVYEVTYSIPQGTCLTDGSLAMCFHHRDVHVFHEII